MKYFLKPKDERKTAVVQIFIKSKWYLTTVKILNYFTKNIRCHLLKLCAFSSEVEA